MKALSGNHIPMNMTIPGTVMGTPVYMSPEQATAGDMDVRTDQYTLGCVLYQMLTGSLPFQEKSLQRLLARQIFAQPEPLRKRAPGIGISVYLERLIGRLMAKRKEDRFPLCVKLLFTVWSELAQSNSTALVVALWF